MQTRLFAINEWNENGIENNEVKIALLKVYNASTIYLRFDAFISLISACDRHTDEADLPYIQLLRAQALQFALAIVDAKNDEELATKIASRNKYKHIDSEYMPWHVPTTRTDITKSATRKEYVRNTVSNAFKNVRHKKYSFVSAAKSKFDECNVSDYLVLNPSFYPAIS